MKIALPVLAKKSINLSLSLFAVIYGFSFMTSQTYAATITDVRNVAKSLNEESWQIMYKGKLTSTPQVTLDLANRTLSINLGTNSIEPSFSKYPFNVSGSVINQIDFYKQNPNSSIIKFALNNPIHLTTVYDQNSIKLTISYTAQVNIPPLTVAIDPGHGGKDPGAIGKIYGIYEKYVTFSIATSLYNILQQDPNFTPVLTRTGDYFIPVPERSVIARQKNAKVLISIHADSSQNLHAIGSSVWVLSTRRAQTETGRLLEHEDVRDSKISGIAPILTDNKSFNQNVIDLQFANQIRLSTGLAQDILGQLDKIANLHSKKPQFASLGVLKSPDFPSILVESGFLSNRVEENRLRNPRYRQEIAVAIYNGLKSYYEQNKAQYLSTTHVTPAAIRQQIIPQADLQIKTGNADSNAASIVIGTKKYKVQAGDTLYGLADKFNVSYQQILSVNKLKHDQIFVGHVINIPLVQTVPLPAVATNLDFSHTIPYIVQAGDNLNKIAYDHHITLDDLLKANPKLQQSKRRVLYVQEQLAIPGILAENTNVSYESETSLTDSGTDYKVKAGDTLSEIALKYDLDVDDIIEFNNLKSKRIYVGQKLDIPQVVVKQVPVTGHHDHDHDHDDFDDNITTNIPNTLSVHNQELADSIKDRLASIPPSDSVAQSIVNAKIAQDPNIVQQYVKSGKLPVETKLVDSGLTYKVQAGDVLSRISSKFGISNSDLISFNRLSKNGHIYINQTLHIPKLQITPLVTLPKIQAIDSKAFTRGVTIPVKVLNPIPVLLNNPNASNSSVSTNNTKASTTTKLVDSGKLYKVRPGDALSIIARKYQVLITNLSSFNHLKSNHIYVGQTLKIPTTVTVEAPALGVTKGLIRGNSATNSGSNSLANKQLSKATGNITTLLPSASTSPIITLGDYKVKAGDNLGLIARKFKTTVSDLVKMNHLTTKSRIYLGQTLKVPQLQANGSKLTTAGIVNNQNANSNLNTLINPITNFNSNDILSTSPAIIAHTVKAGDSLSSIATQYGISVNELLETNKLLSLGKIKIGQVLVIPDIVGKVVSYHDNAQNPNTDDSALSTLTRITTIYGKNNSTPTSPSLNLAKTEQIYRVKPGDVLYLIAKKYHVSLSSLLENNNLTTKSRIQPGQVLKIPTRASTSPTNSSTNVNINLSNNVNPTPTSSTSSQAQYLTHTIQKGEVLSVIAEKYNLGLSVLLKANNLTLKSRIHPGQVLKIPVIGKQVPVASLKPVEYNAEQNTATSTNRAYAQTVAPIPQYITYVVKPGDSLGIIAEKYHMGLSVLKALNNLKSNHIYVGQKLKVQIK